MADIYNNHGIPGDEELQQMLARGGNNGDTGGQGFLGTLDDYGNLVANAMDRLPVGAAIDWADRKVGSPLARIGAAVTGAPSVEEYRKNYAKRGAESAARHPMGQFVADLGSVALDPTMYVPFTAAMTLPKAAAMGAAYGVSGGYGDAANKADQEGASVDYGLSNAATDAAIGGTVGGAVHGVLNNTFVRSGIDKTSDAIRNGRETITDALKKLSPLKPVPEEEKKLWSAFKSAQDELAKGTAPAKASAEELRDAVIHGADDNPNWRQRAADYGYNPETGSNAFTGSRRDSENVIDKMLAPETKNLAQAKQMLAAQRVTKRPTELTDAMNNYNEALDTFNRRRKELIDLRENGYNKAMFEGTPTEHSLSGVNPARLYSEETGAIRGKLGADYNPEQVSSPDVHQARVVMRNANLDAELPYQREMWQGDLALRKAAQEQGLTQEQVENMFSRAARDTVDPITGTAADRTAQQQAAQGEKFHQNVGEIYNEIANGRRDENLLSRAVRPSTEENPFKDWPREKAKDLARIARDADYRRAVAADPKKASLSDAGLSAEMQHQIAKEMLKRSVIADKALHHLGTIGGAAGSAVLGSLYGGHALGLAGVGTALASKYLDKGISRLLGVDALEKSIPAGGKALKYELQKTLNAVHGLPETKGLYKPTKFQKYGGIEAAIALNRMLHPNETVGDDSDEKPLLENAGGNGANGFNEISPPVSAEKAHEIIKKAPETLAAAGINAAGSGQGSGRGAGMPNLNFQGDYAQTIKQASKPEFWGGISKILAALAGGAIGVKPDYGIVDRVNSLKNRYGYDAETANSLGATPAAYQRAVEQREDEAYKERIAERNAQLAVQKEHKMEIKTLPNGEIVGVNPYDGSQKLIREGMAQNVQLSPQQQNQLGALNGEIREHERNLGVLDSFAADIAKIGNYYSGWSGRLRYEKDSAAYGANLLKGKDLQRYELANALEGRRGILLGARLKIIAGSRPTDSARKTAEATVPSIFQPKETALNHINDMRKDIHGALQEIDRQQQKVLSGYGGYATTKGGIYLNGDVQ